MDKKSFTKENFVSLGLLLILFLYMFALNFMMPLHRDDYEYALIWGTYEKINSWPDVFQSLYIHYFEHGGRMVSFLVLDSFLLLGKNWFNPFNAFLFVWLVIIIYWHSQRNITFKFNPYILSLVIVFCWLGFPDFALVNIWMTGSCVYLLTAAIIFTFLLPYNLHFWGKSPFKDNYGAAFLMFLGGIVAGWTVENTAATMNFIILWLMFYAYKKHSLTKWMTWGLAGSLIGFFMLVVAPGNFVRYAGSNSKLYLHFTNQLAAGAQIFLYVLPIILFIVLSWRILRKSYALENGCCEPSDGQIQKNGDMGFNISSLLIAIMILFIAASYANDFFFSKWLANLMYDNIAAKLEIATVKLQKQFFNTMSGLEEIVLYLLVIISIYRHVFRKLNLRKRDLNILPKYKWREIAGTYPGCRYAAALISLAILNNLVMLASPSFPGRAGYGSVVFLIIGAACFLNNSKVAEYLLDRGRKKYLAFFAGIIFVPMAALVLQQHLVLYKENTERMVYVEQMAAQGVDYLELEPLNITNKVLRHVYFVELNNPVSKHGFCRYYLLKDVNVKENNND